MTPNTGAFTTLSAGTDSANYQSLVGAVTTKTPIHSVAGTDTNIALALQSKGTGGIDLAAGSSGVNISNGTTVTSITRTVGGTAYSTAPSVIISAPTLATGVQATATCTVTAGVVDTLFTITNAGSGYIEQPTITFSGGGGSGAIAFVTIGADIEINNLGQNAKFNTDSGTALALYRAGTNNNGGYWQVGSGLSTPVLKSSGTSGTISSGGAGALNFYTNNIAQLQLAVAHTASAVNYVQVTGSVTGSQAIVQAQGSDVSGIRLAVFSKGAGAVRLGNATSIALDAYGTSSSATYNYFTMTAGTAGVAATLGVLAGGSTPDTNVSLALQPKGTGIVLTNQNTPVAYNATATLLIADILSQIITSISATAVTLTLPTGTLTDAGISGGTSAINTAFEWSIINLGSAVGIITLAAGTGHTIVGLTTLAIVTSARFKTVKTATNTFITYRIA